MHIFNFWENRGKMTKHFILSSTATFKAHLFPTVYVLGAPLSKLQLWFIVQNEWEMLDCSGDGPEELEEHSMVAYKVINQDYTVHTLTFYFLLYSIIKCRRLIRTEILCPKIIFLLVQFWM